MKEGEKEGNVVIALPYALLGAATSSTTFWINRHIFHACCEDTEFIDCHACMHAASWELIP